MGERLVPQREGKNVKTILRRAAPLVTIVALGLFSAATVVAANPHQGSQGQGSQGQENQGQENQGQENQGQGNQGQGQGNDGEGPGNQGQGNDDQGQGNQGQGNQGQGNQGQGQGNDGEGPGNQGQGNDDQGQGDQGDQGDQGGQDDQDDQDDQGDQGDQGHQGGASDPSMQSDIAPESRTLFCSTNGDVYRANGDGMGIALNLPDSVGALMVQLGLVKPAIFYQGIGASCDQLPGFNDSGLWVDHVGDVVPGVAVYPLFVPA